MQNNWVPCSSRRTRPRQLIKYCERGSAEAFLNISHVGEFIARHLIRGEIKQSEPLPTVKAISMWLCIVTARRNSILQVGSGCVSAWLSLQTCVRRIVGRLEYVNLHVTLLIQARSLLYRLSLRTVPSYIAIWYRSSSWVVSTFGF